MPEDDEILVRPEGDLTVPGLDEFVAREAATSPIEGRAFPVLQVEDLLNPADQPPTLDAFIDQQQGAQLDLSPPQPGGHGPGAGEQPVEPQMPSLRERRRQGTVPGFGTEGTQENILQAAQMRTSLGGGLGTISPLAPQRGRPPSSFLEQELVIRRELPPEVQARLAQMAAGAQQARAQAAAARVNGYEDMADGFEADAAQNYAEALAYHDIVEEATRETDQEIGKLRAMTDRLGDIRINPQAFWDNAGDGARFAGAMAIAAGTIAQSITGVPNTALDIIDRAITRDLQAQMANANLAMQTVSAQRNLVGALQTIYNDRLTGFAAARHIRLAAAAADMRRRAARAAGTQEGANFLAAEAELQSRAAQAAAEAWKNDHSVRIYMKLAMSSRLARRYIETGTLEAINDDLNRSPTGARARTLSMQRTGQEQFITIQEAAERRRDPQFVAQFELVPSTADPSMVQVVPRDRWNPASVEQAERVLARGGRVIGPEGDFSQFGLTEETMGLLQDAISAESRSQVIRGLMSMATLERGVQQLRRISERMAWQPISAWGNEDAQVAAGIVSRMRIAVGAMNNLGALAEHDLKLVEDVVANPVSFFDRGNIEVLDRSVQNFSEAIGSEIEAIGGSYRPRGGAMGSVDERRGDPREAPEPPGVVDRVMGSLGMR